MILPTVEKPSRYTGGEWGESEFVPSKMNYCICFPDVYEVGMSNLGIKIVAESVKSVEGTSVDRCFAPWQDFGVALKQNGIPLYSLNGKMSLAEFDMIGFSLSYEMSYTAVLYMLDLAGIPLRSKDRGNDFPVVQAGGPCVCNPEPLAEFIDIFTIGDGEEVMADLARLKRDIKDKRQFLIAASKLDGVYVPAFMNVKYENGKITGFERLDFSNDENGEKSVYRSVNDDFRVKKAMVKDLDGAIFPKEFGVASTEAVFDRAIIEVTRGCYRSCRFCQAGFLYRPVRPRSVETLTEQACSIVTKGGYSELSLNSLSTGDYPQLGELLDSINARLPDIKMSLPSLRVDSFKSYYAKFARQSSVTFAPEAGTQRLRDVINKDITEDEIERGVENAFNLGYSSVKLYFMMGLPTETDEDLLGIAKIVRMIKGIYGRNPASARALRVSVSVSTFIPKPFTPFQYERQITKEEVAHKVEILKKELFIKGVSFSWNEFELSQIEAVLARGDRRLCDVVEKAYRKGCVFDGWQQCFKPEMWYEALNECGLTPEDYTREHSEDEILPWDFIDLFIDKSFLLRERHAAYSGKVSGGCQSGCKACGIQKVYKCTIKG